jgi:putative Holliday junction resolvase
VKVLALDYGRARTGVAASDATGEIARPLGALARVDTPQGQAELDEIIARERPDVILVGEPRLLSGKAGAQARAARGFAGRLRARTAIPVELVDERMTTAEARRRARDGARSDTDSLAACLLVEAYLAGVR